MPSREQLLTDRWALTLDRLASSTADGLLSMWDQMDSWTPADADRFHELAKPFVLAAATSAQKATVGYGEALAPGLLKTPSPLIVEAAGARVYDPFDRLGHVLGTGGTIDDALSQARQVVDQLGHDSINTVARQTTADTMTVVFEKFKRRVSGNSCDWCLDMSQHEWWNPEDATFGHTKCDCRVVPAEALGDHNDKVIAERGFDAQNFKVKQRATALRRQERTATEHAATARQKMMAATTGEDVKRYSHRMADWETRAARLREQLAAAGA